MTKMAIIDQYSNLNIVIQFVIKANQPTWFDPNLVAEIPKRMSNFFITVDVQNLEKAEIRTHRRPDSRHFWTSGIWIRWVRTLYYVITQYRIAWFYSSESGFWTRLLSRIWTEGNCLGSGRRATVWNLD